MRKCTAGNWLSEGWRAFSQHRWLLLSGVLILLVVSLLQQLLERWGGLITFPPGTETAAASSPNGFLLFMDYFVSLVIRPLLDVGYQFLALRAVRDEGALGDMLAPFRLPLPVLGAYWLTHIIMALGFLLLVIPGVIWTLRYMFSPLLAVDKRRGALKALGESRLITLGYSRSLLGLGLVYLGLFLFLGGVGYLLVEGLVRWELALLISSGVQLVFKPWFAASFAAAYRDLDEAFRTANQPDPESDA